MCVMLYCTGVSDMAYGSGPHVVAMTTVGGLYSWGHHSYGQLGLGAIINSGQVTVPRLIEGPLGGVKVTQVACGGQHTLALTSTGEVKGCLLHKLSCETSDTVFAVGICLGIQ